ncbi:MAG: tRNA lysidine(34) synthetase TilS [Acidiferrobacterales bacterium]
MSSKKNSDSLTVDGLHHQLQSIVGDYERQNLRLAFSGGLDSTVLLHSLAGLRATRNLDLRAIHVHHGLHQDADAWTETCIDQCKRLDIELVVEKVEVVPDEHGLEAAARKARYQALAKHIRSESDELLTAHHRDDQAETLLLHLVRGAGVNGLAGMPPRRRFEQGWLSRPLLETSRDAIRAYALKNRLAWIEDDSNTDPAIRRSFLRQAVIPQLTRHWPGAISAMAQAASHLREAEILLAHLAEGDLESCQSDENLGLSVTAVANLPPERMRNLLRHWVLSQGADVPTTRQLAQLVQRILQPPKTARAELVWGSHRVRLYQDRLWLESGVAATVVHEVTPLTWDLNASKTLSLGNLSLLATEGTGEGLARARIGSKIEVRMRQGGERCRLPGRKHHTSVKSLLQQHRISPWDRSSIPLLYVDNELAAIGDRWYCEPFAAKRGEQSWVFRMAKTGSKTD